MSKKMKGADLFSTTPYGVGAYEDNRARLKYQTLMQDYHELQKDTDITRSRLELGKQKKMVLDAEVRFLRKRFRYIVKTKTMNSSLKEKLAQPPSNLHKQSIQTDKLGTKEAALRMLPPIPEKRPKKKQYMNREEALYGTSSFSQQRMRISESGKESSTISDSGHRARVDMRKNNPMRKKAPFFDLNKKERTYANDTAPSNTSPAFDLNQDGFSGRESSLPSRAPVFDLNEISTGEDDIQTFAEETRSNLLRHDEVQNDPMLSVCRNAGEGQSRVGKRKISWQDQVALRV